MVKKVWLNYAIAKKNNMFVNREEMLSKYDNDGRFCTDKYKLAIGMPVLVNIQGHYIKASDLPFLTRMNLNDYLSSLRTGQPTTDVYIFKWSVYTKC